MARVCRRLLADLRSARVGFSAPAAIVAFYESKVVALCAEEKLVVRGRLRRLLC